MKSFFATKTRLELDTRKKNLCPRVFNANSIAFTKKDSENARNVQKQMFHVKQTCNNCEARACFLDKCKCFT